MDTDTARFGLERHQDAFVRDANCSAAETAHNGDAQSNQIAGPRRQAVVQQATGLQLDGRQSDEPLYYNALFHHLFAHSLFLDIHTTPLTH